MIVGAEGIRIAALLAIGTWAVAAAAPLGATPRTSFSGDVPLSDLLEVLVLDRTLVAVDARGGGAPTAPLRLDETVLWTDARGAVGLVITDQRLLAVSVDSAAWQETRWQRSESPPARADLGDRVALVTTEKRIIGFDGGSGNLVESVLGLRERLVALRVDENVAVIVTDRRALGLSPFAGGFFPVKLDLGDPVREVVASANLVTITTDHRLLIFRGPTGTWAERRLGLD